MIGAPTSRRLGRALPVASLAALLGLVTSVAAAAHEHERAAELYFDELALQLAEPGLWVDQASAWSAPPDVAAALDQAAKDAPVPMRLAIIPASVLVDPGSAPGGVELLWESPEMATKLYERVGIDGVYAILVDAPSADEGRGFWAVQHADEGPTYHVESAVEQAIECCAPEYAAMLDRFIQRASEVDRPLYAVAAPWVAAVIGLFGLWWVGTSLLARRRERRENEQHTSTVGPLLNEEVIELSETVSALPTTSDIKQARLTRDVLDTVEQARHRLDTLAGDDDIAAVTMLLGDARHLVHCLTALHRGEPMPERTQPCFFDPRHGPSTEGRQWAPELTWGDDGAVREIRVCAACAARLDRQEAPAARLVGRQNYWEAGEDLVAYIDGYWRAADQLWRFPDPRHQRARQAIQLRRRNGRPAQQLVLATAFVRNAAKEMVESSRNEDSGGGFGGGSAGSSSVSSSGGGRF